MVDRSDQDYKAQLGVVLRSGNAEALHLFLRQSASGYGDERQISEVEQRSHGEMEELLHRMILARSDLADLHAESRTWLASNNLAAPASRRASGTGEPNQPRPAGQKQARKKGS